MGYAIDSSRSHGAVIRVYDATGNVIEVHEHKGEFKSCERRQTRKQRHNRHTVTERREKMTQ